MDRYEKHLPGMHDQLQHGRRIRAKYSSTYEIIPTEKRKSLIQSILKDLDASDAKVEIKGPGPVLDFGDGDIGVPYGIYEDKSHQITLYDEAFHDGEVTLVGMLAHETSHDKYLKARENKPEVYKGLRKTLYHELEKLDGISEYSRKYWKMLSEPGKGSDATFGGVSRSNCVDETLAELNKLAILNPAAMAGVNRAWLDLDKKVKEDSRAVQKHLPGMHDQLSHAGERTSVAKPKQIKYGPHANEFISSGKQAFLKISGGKSLESMSVADINTFAKNIKFGNGKVDIAVNGTGFSSKDSKLIMKCANWLHDAVAAPDDIIHADVSKSKTDYSEATDDEIYLAKNDFLADDLAHEYGHWLENARTNVAAKEFLNARKTGKIEDDKEDEAVIWDDKFIDSYAGKQYMKHPEQNTEIVSTGLEYLYGHPAKFAKYDPDHFYFILGIISPWKTLRS